jgi:hypothetical protein
MCEAKGICSIQKDSDLLNVYNCSYNAQMISPTVYALQDRPPEFVDNLRFDPVQAGNLQLPRNLPKINLSTLGLGY